MVLSFHDYERVTMERLQKVIASAGITSRRKAEELILKGKVAVNGEIVSELGTKVSKKDIIMIGTKGKTIRTPASGISVIGRNTKGVNVFTLENDEKIASVSIIQNNDD